MRGVRSAVVLQRVVGGPRPAPSKVRPKCKPVRTPIPPLVNVCRSRSTVASKSGHRGSDMAPCTSNSWNASTPQSATSVLRWRSTAVGSGRYINEAPDNHVDGLRERQACDVAHDKLHVRDARFRRTRGSDPDGLGRPVHACHRTVGADETRSEKRDVAHPAADVQDPHCWPHASITEQSLGEIAKENRTAL